MLFRPLVGYWSDRWSEFGVMIAGLIVQGTSVGLCFVPLIGATVLANGCRGIGWACFNSSATPSSLNARRRNAGEPRAIIAVSRQRGDFAPGSCALVDRCAVRQLSRGF
jgi:hypothetical protein